MIVQCEACQTKFRLADEKVKPGGTKVRCSKCKEIFTVMPPAPEPEPVEETVDFNAMNMEKVEDEPSAEEPSLQEPPAPETQEEPAPPTPEPEPEQEEAPAADEMEVDFSGLESEMGENAGQGDELADEFTFADTSQLTDESDEEEEEESGDLDLEQTPDMEQPAEDPDFGAAFEESEDITAGGGAEFDFSEEPAQDTAASDDSVDFSGPEGGGEFDFSEEEPSATEEETGEFSFDSDDDALSFDDDSSSASEEPAVEESGELSFGGDGDDAFSFDEGDSSEPTDNGSGDFSFDEENPFGDDSGSGWEDNGSGDSDSFDFDEPQFDSESAAGTVEEPSSEDDGLQFGEIAFDSDSDDDSTAPGFEENSFESASMEEREEPESFVEERKPEPPRHDDEDDDDLPLPPPPKPKKSALSRILLLLVLLLLILGGAAGFLFVQEGSLNVNTITKYLPFLEEYLGKAAESGPVERIGINIQGSSYVNGQAGQMLVIQGTAVNNFPASRSAITLKGILLDEQGNTLLQQTVFCGNKLTDAALQSKPWAAIEEAMNNQFGDSLSNMNVGAGASIPFTIVFRNLPDNIANINVEVVESKPGAG